MMAHTGRPGQFLATFGVLQLLFALSSNLEQVLPLRGIFWAKYRFRAVHIKPEKVNNFTENFNFEDVTFTANASQA